MNVLTLLGIPTATVIALIVSVGIPFVSALLAKAHWPAHVVGALTLLLAAVNGLLSEYAAHPDHFAWKAAVGTAIVSYVIALAARFGILKDTQLDADLRAVGSRNTAPARQHAA